MKFFDASTVWKGSRSEYLLVLGIMTLRLLVPNYKGDCGRQSDRVSAFLSFAHEPRPSTRDGWAKSWGQARSVRYVSL